MGFFLHFCSVPLFLKLKTIATLCCYEGARDCCLLLSIGRLWYIPLAANKQPWRKSSSSASPQECISHWFVSRMTPPELTFPKISFFPPPFTLSLSLLRSPFTAPFLSPPPFSSHVVFTLSPPPSAALYSCSLCVTAGST